MNIKNIYDSILNRLQDEMNGYVKTIENYPLHAHVVSMQVREKNQETIGRFKISLSMSKRVPYSYNDDNDVVSTIYCNFIPELFDQCIMVRVELKRMKLHDGERKPDYSNYNSYNQKWRHEGSFIVEAQPNLLFMLLEHNANMEKVVESVLKE